jgi:hypothetical protein
VAEFHVRLKGIAALGTEIQGNQASRLVFIFLNPGMEKSFHGNPSSTSVLAKFFK